MGVILPGVDWTGRDFPPRFFVDWDGMRLFLWEWDGRGLRIPSRVTL